jgi:DnaK suppressor protein
MRERRRLLGRVRAPKTLVNPDTLDAAKDLEEEQLWLAVAERRGEIHDQIDEAVRLLSEGRYGRCVDCRMDIPPARLRVLPFAIRCLACQERLERGNRPMVSWPSFA